MDPLATEQLTLNVSQVHLSLKMSKIFLFNSELLIPSTHDSFFPPLLHVTHKFMPTSISNLVFVLSYTVLGIRHHFCPWNLTSPHHLPEMLFSLLSIQVIPIHLQFLNILFAERSSYILQSHCYTLRAFIQFFVSLTMIHNSTFKWMLCYLLNIL